MKAHKIKFKRPFAEGYTDLVQKLLCEDDPVKRMDTDDDKLLLAALVEVKDKLAAKLLHQQELYSLKLTPVQSIALRLFYNDYVKDSTSYMGNALMKIANESHQKFTV